MESILITNTGFQRTVNNSVVATISFDAKGLQHNNAPVVDRENILQHTSMTLPQLEVVVTGNQVLYRRLDSNETDLAPGVMVLISSCKIEAADVHNYMQSARKSVNRSVQISTDHESFIGVRRFVSYTSLAELVPANPTTCVASLKSGLRVIIISNGFGHAQHFTLMDNGNPLHGISVDFVARSVDHLSDVLSSSPPLNTDQRVFLPQQLTYNSHNLSAGFYRVTQSPGENGNVKMELDPILINNQPVSINDTVITCFGGNDGLKSVYRLTPVDPWYPDWNDPKTFQVDHVFEQLVTADGVCRSISGAVGTVSAGRIVDGIQTAVASVHGTVTNPLHVLSTTRTATLRDFIGGTLFLSEGICDVTQDVSDLENVLVTLRIPASAVHRCVLNGPWVTGFVSAYNHYEYSHDRDRPHFIVAEEPLGGKQGNTHNLVDVGGNVYEVKSLHLYSSLVPKICEKVTATTYKVVYAFWDSGSGKITVGNCIYDSATNDFSGHGSLLDSPWTIGGPFDYQMESLPVIDASGKRTHIVLVWTLHGWTVIQNPNDARHVQSTTHVEGYGLQATSTTSGALTVNGGLGVQGDLYCENVFSLSDVNHKSNIERMSPEESLITIQNLHPCTYDLKGHRSAGLLAQQVQPLVPHCVNQHAPSGIMSINYQSVLAHVISAVQKQARQNKTQKRLLKRLKRNAVKK